MSYKIECTESHITGALKLPGASWEQDYISISKLAGKWSVGTSTCLPSTIESAKEVMECYQAVFEKLKEIENEE